MEDMDDVTCHAYLYTTCISVTCNMYGFHVIFI